MGASGDDDNFTGPGWRPHGKLIADSGEGGDQFGYRVSIGDDTIVVTALRDDDKGTDAGAAYIFAEG